MPSLRCVLFAAAFVTIAAYASGETLTRFLTAQGCSAIHVERRFGNHLFIPSTINGRRAALLIDTSAMVSVVHRGSAATFGLQLTGSAAGRRGIFGEMMNGYGRATLRSLQLGDRTLSNVAVVIADQAARVDPPEFLPITKLKWNAKRKSLGFYTRVDPVDGLLGLDVLRRTGAILDCGHQMLFLSPTASARSLDLFLADHGFARIAMHMSNGKFEVPAMINGHEAQLIIDTGSSFTLLGKNVAAAAGVLFAPVRLAYDVGGNHLEPLSNATVRDLRIGNFQMENAGINVADIRTEAGLFGIDQLSMNYAVIDFATSTLYLRHPDRR